MKLPRAGWARKWARRPQAASALVVTAVLLATACPMPAVEPGPTAKACGQVVAHYLGIDAAIEVVDAETRPESGKVRIDYRSLDAMNTPLEGVALCRFEEDQGHLTLTGAFVDENRLLDAEVARFNASHSAG
jgi:hypothetical protein